MSTDNLDLSRGRVAHRTMTPLYAAAMTIACAAAPTSRPWPPHAANRHTRAPRRTRMHRPRRNSACHHLPPHEHHGLEGPKLNRPGSTNGGRIMVVAQHALEPSELNRRAIRASQYRLTRLGVERAEHNRPRRRGLRSAISHGAGRGCSKKARSNLRQFACPRPTSGTPRVAARYLDP